MSQVATVEPASATAPAGAHRAQRRSWDLGRWRMLLIGVAAAWAVAVGTYLVGAAAIVPLLILVGTASLIHGGRSLLDRIMIALSLLLGASCLALLLFSVWPWGLHPIAVGGVALTVLVTVAVVTGRRPQLPRPTFGDAMTVGAAALIAAIVALPFVRTTFRGRLAIVASGEDFGRHVTVFDAAQQVGGYLFLHWHAATQHAYEGMVSYPQASHVLSALLDNFVRSSGHASATGTDAMNHYLGFVVAGYALFALAAMWAAQWLAGPTLTDARRLGLVGAVAIFCLVSEIFMLVAHEYTAEVAGLIPAVLLVAVLCRPPSRRTTTVAVLLVVAVSFSYYLYLPAAGLMFVVWLLRRRMWRLRPYQFVFAGVALLAAAIPPVVGLTLGDQTRALLVVASQPPATQMLEVGLIVLAGLCQRQAFRSSRWRTYWWSIGSVAAVAAALYVVQRLMGGIPSLGGYYYTNKVLHLLLAVLAVGAGAILNHLPAPDQDRSSRTSLAVKGARLLPGVLVVLALSAVTGLLVNDQAGAVPARAWARGDWYVHNDTATSVTHELARFVPPGTTTVVITADPLEAYSVQLFIAALQRSAGTLAPGMYNYAVEDPSRYEAMVASISGPVLISTDGSDEAAELVARIQARHGEQIVDVVRLDD